VFSTKAFEAKNKCRQCAICPVCAQTLGIMAKENDEHFLRCEFCKWTSEKIGLVANSSAALFDMLMSHEEQSEVSTEFNRLLTSLEEKTTKKKRHELTTIQPSFNDVVTAVAKVEKSLDAKNKSLHILPTTQVENPNAKPGQDGETSGCTLQQRFTHSEVCVKSAEEYWPARVELFTKMGCRCPRCDRFLIKPKAGANRTNFDVQFVALSVLPRVTVGEFEPLKKGVPTKFILYFKNPLEHAVDMQFSKSGESKQEEKGPVVESFSDVSFPTAAISLSPYAETAEQADGKPSALLASDDPALVGYRVNSKVGVFVTVTPRAEKVRFTVLLNLNVRPGKSQRPIETFAYQLIVDLGSAS